MTRRERLRLALSVSYVDLPRLQPITLKSDETILTRRERVLLAVALGLAVLAMLVGCGGSARGAEAIPPASSPPVRAESKHAWCDACADLPNLGTQPKVRRAK